MRLRATRLTAVAQAARVALGLSIQPAAAYSLRRLPFLAVPYSGPAVRVRQSATNAEADIGFDADGNLDLDALTLHCGAPRRPLLAVPGADAAFSLRRLGNYSGPAIRVRSSNGNAELDIGFTAAGDLDTTALLAFTGANSGFVTTWYDQSGNGRNATQTTAANQPRIVNAGVVNTEGGRPTMVTTATGQGLFRNDPTLAAIIVGPNFGVSVVCRTADTAQRHPFGNRNPNGFFIRSVAGGASWAASVVGGGGSGSTLTTPTTAFQIVSAGQAAGSMRIFSNGVGGSTGTASVVPTSYSNNVMIFGGGSFDFIGSISEVVVLPIAFDAADRTLLEQSQAAYYGITYATALPSGFVTTWYDQSGNARHAVQTTATNQPRIVNAGVVGTSGARPTINFLSTSRMIATGVPWGPNTTHNAVGLTSITGTYARLMNGGTGDLYAFLGGVSGNLGTFVGNGVAWNDVTANNPPLSVTTAAVMTFTTDGTTLRPYVRGAAQTTKNGATSSTSNIAIGNAPDSFTQGWTGPVFEVLVFPSVLSTTDRQSLERNQGAYYGIAVA